MQKYAAPVQYSHEYRWGEQRVHRLKYAMFICIIRAHVLEGLNHAVAQPD